MKPARFDDTFKAGDDYNMVITLDGDVIGSTSKLVIRDMGTGNPYIVCTGLPQGEGVIIFVVPSTATANLNPLDKPSRYYYYDLEYTSPEGKITTLCTGRFTVLRDLSLNPNDSGE